MEKLQEYEFEDSRKEYENFRMQDGNTLLQLYIKSHKYTARYEIIYYIVSIMLFHTYRDGDSDVFIVKNRYILENVNSFELKDIFITINIVFFNLKTSVDLSRTSANKMIKYILFI